MLAAGRLRVDDCTFLNQRAEVAGNKMQVCATQMRLTVGKMWLLRNIRNSFTWHTSYKRNVSVQNTAGTGAHIRPQYHE